MLIKDQINQANVYYNLYAEKQTEATIRGQREENSTLLAKIWGQMLIEWLNMALIPTNPKYKCLA